jgi:RHS repeat-associated protein
VREWVWAQVDGVWQWQPQTETRFVYDGMNVVQERNGADEITAKNVWGASMGGGIGGLLSRSVAQGDLFYHYDGRGNVVQLTDANAQAVARYSYDAFGGLRRSEGAADSLNPYRFSTKWMHGFSGLSDYGFRFYAPQLGKWINRDPIAEKGGLNIYEFVLSNPVTHIDSLGLLPVWLETAIAVVISGVTSLLIGLGAATAIGSAGAGALLGACAIAAATGFATAAIAYKLSVTECDPFDWSKFWLKSLTGALVGCMAGMLALVAGAWAVPASTLTNAALLAAFNSVKMQIVNALAGFIPAAFQGMLDAAVAHSDCESRRRQEQSSPHCPSGNCS